MFYRLKSILFSFLYKLSVLTGFRKPVVRNLLFRDFCLNDYPGNAFYANEKEPRVRPRFPLVERDGFEPSKSVTTDLQSVPFGRSGTSPYGASEWNRTLNLLITNQLLCRLSYASIMPKEGG